MLSSVGPQCKESESPLWAGLYYPFGRRATTGDRGNAFVQPSYFCPRGQPPQMNEVPHPTFVSLEYGYLTLYFVGSKVLPTGLLESRD